MGGCTSKPKVLKDDEAFAPEPAPEKVIGEEKETLPTELAPQQAPEKVVEEVETEPASQKVVEKEEAVNGVVDEGFEKNGEGKDSSVSETVKDYEDEKVKSEEEQTAAPEKVKKEEVKPAVEAQNSETLDKKPEEKTETLEEKKQEEAKPEPEKIPIFSFFTSLMGQKN